ncbi:MAG: hypothetical protein DWB56_10490 [Candidatus Jettenia sp.]|nr:hypothetical protein [Candidatus Jettenia sp.]GIL19254.1 MAG: hypothetical protein BroJett041_03680 [Candidatus Jettenia caeni]
MLREKPLAMTNTLEPLMVNQLDVHTPNPSQEGSINVPSREGIEGWVKSLGFCLLKTQPTLHYVRY